MAHLRIRVPRGWVFFTTLMAHEVNLRPSQCAIKVDVIRPVGLKKNAKTLGSCANYLYLYSIIKLKYRMETIEIMNNLKETTNELVSEFPFSKIYISTLGGEVNASLMVTVGLDKREDWSHGIFENSRFVRYHIDRNRKGVEIECFQFHIKTKEIKKFRRFTGTPEKVIERFKKDLKKLKDLN